MTDTYDFVIVGGGSAGCVLAARLTEDPACRVLLIEAGAVELDPVADQLLTIDFSLTGRDWGLSATGVGAAVVPYPQGKAAGGGSAVNGAVALRGVPGDYDGWADAGNPDWSWAKLVPFFRRMERDAVGGKWHGTDGPIPIVRYSPDELIAPQRALLDACLARGWTWTDDHNAPDATGVGSLPMNRAEGKRMSTNICYLQPVLSRRNITVWDRSRVVQLLFDHGAVAAIDVARDGVTERVSAGEVILSAGAIQSPSLLMRSGIGPADVLDRAGVPVRLDLAGVGANLMEHPGTFVFVKPQPGAVDLAELQFQLFARYTSGLSGRDNDMQLSMMNHWDLRPLPELGAVVGAEVVFAITCGLQAPQSRGRVRITSADPTSPPTIALDMLAHPADVAALVVGARVCRDIARSDAFADRTESIAVLDERSIDDDDAVAAYVRSFCMPWYHASGTCAMGPSPDTGAVVDQHGRVHGVDKLRVFDASIMPVIPRANTNLSAIVIGERAAELLRA